MKKQLAEIQAEIHKLEDLLAQADPDGYFKEGTRAARLAKEKGIRLHNQDKDRKIALEKKKRQEAVKHHLHASPLLSAIADVSLASTIPRP